MDKKLRDLPEKTLGKAGRDHFSKDKELTVVMFPYQCHSAFSKAIQELYKVLSVPFNLIVVEGNAPTPVRCHLDDFERRYGSMSVLYSEKYLSPGEAINLARPQVKTRYAFFMDNEIRVKPGCVERMLTNAKNWKTDIVFPKNSLIAREYKTPQQDLVRLETPGMRLAFLISFESLSALLKVDERTDLYTAGWDLMLTFQAKGLRTMISDEAWVESLPEHAIRSDDRSLYQHQWDLDRHREVIGYFQNKWGLEIKDGVYQRWFESKNLRGTMTKPPAFLPLQFFLSRPFVTKAKPVAVPEVRVPELVGNASSLGGGL